MTVSFLGEGSPANIDYRNKVGALILTTPTGGGPSLSLEGLQLNSVGGKPSLLVPLKKLFGDLFSV